MPRSKIKKKKTIYVSPSTILLSCIIILLLVFILFLYATVTNFKQVFMFESRRAISFCKDKGSLGGFISYDFYPKEDVSIHCYMPDKIFTTEDMLYG